MLTKLIIRNFKALDAVEIDLGDPVVFAGPNSSGKTSAMQALTLWDLGVRLWKEKRHGRRAQGRLPGVAINRLDPVYVPVPSAIMLWRHLRVRATKGEEADPRLRNVRMEIVVEGIADGGGWACGLEFDYANEESFYCRPLRLGDGGGSSRMPVPECAGETPVAYLSPMAGLISHEVRIDPGAINVRFGEGRTAEVLRNLCHVVHTERSGEWEHVVGRIRDLFGVTLGDPRYVSARGELRMGYREGKAELDLSCGGRGLLQTLLVLVFLCNNPGSVALMDEPDAHLEILRQRQIYSLITEEARRLGIQLIVSSRSGAAMDEAVRSGDTVVSFAGKPHKLQCGGPDAPCAGIGIEQVLQAEQAGWVLYLGEPSDLRILRAFAKRLGHTGAMDALRLPYVRYVSHNQSEAIEHSHALADAVPGLRAVALFGNPPDGTPDDWLLQHLCWNKREIENYLCTREALEEFARSCPADHSPPLDERLGKMRGNIADIERAMSALDLGSPWDGNAQVRDNFLVPLLNAYFKSVGISRRITKNDLHMLVEHIPDVDIDPEVVEKLDAIAKVARPPS